MPSSPIFEGEAMDINQAIAKSDFICPNTVDNKEKIFVLSQLDGRVKTDIFDKYDTDDGSGFSGYTENTSMDTDLLIPYPFDNIYVSRLVAEMYLLLGENDEYNNWLIMFNSEYEAYERYYAQSHDQKSPVNFTYF